MAQLRLSDRRAPIEYAGVRRAYQGARSLGALAVGAVGVAGMLWGVGAAVALVVGSGLELAHSVYHLRRPGASALVPLLADTTLVGLMLLMADLPQAQFAVAAYLLAASILLLPLTEAALVLAYAATWAAIVANLAPLGVAIGGNQRVTLNRAAGVIFLALMAMVLFSAAKFIHAFRRRQDEALEAERRTSAVKSQFVSMVSHEFRTPLTSIAGFTEMLRDNRDSLSDDEIAEFLEIIHNEARHLSNLVEDVLVIPRLEAERMPFEPERFELAGLAEAVIEVIFPHGEGKDTVVAIAHGLTVHADPTRVAQVLRNLLQNARKYGGDQILIEALQRADRVQVVVSDNGPGVAVEHRDRIFEHFEQVSRGDSRTDSGIGLGLPIARRLVQAMGGDLWHEPRFPTGSRFCFTLPATGGASEKVEPAAETTAA